MSTRMGLAGACAWAACGAAAGDFSGPYAPELWTFFTDAGGFVERHTIDQLILVGGDVSSGGGAGDTALMISVAADGVLLFDWEYFTPLSSPGYDPSYFSINGVFLLLGSADGVIKTGSVSVNVAASDLLGFHVDSLDGIFGPGTLTITDFSAPVPAPGAIALLTPLLLAARRRSLAPIHSRSSP